ncbi:MAG: hypothetical protein BRD30_07575 [Bacteroidetes bacterium QH_2_63_10]|nr:MAG: hypothetical protein BRD30_07575 [Bacteroidetes bacterium QH_2_63_10]
MVGLVLPVQAVEQGDLSFRVLGGGHRVEAGDQEGVPALSVFEAGQVWFAVERVGQGGLQPGAPHEAEAGRLPEKRVLFRSGTGGGRADPVVPRSPRSVELSIELSDGLRARWGRYDFLHDHQIGISKCLGRHRDFLIVLRAAKVVQIPRHETDPRRVGRRVAGRISRLRRWGVASRAVDRRAGLQAQFRQIEARHVHDPRVVQSHQED